MFLSTKCGAILFMGKKELAIRGKKERRTKTNL